MSKSKQSGVAGLMIFGIILAVCAVGYGFYWLISDDEKASSNLVIGTKLVPVTTSTQTFTINGQVITIPPGSLVGGTPTVAAAVPAPVASAPVAAASTAAAQTVTVVVKKVVVAGGSSRNRGAGNHDNHGNGFHGDGSSAGSGNGPAAWSHQQGGLSSGVDVHSGPCVPLPAGFARAKTDPGHKQC